jgi:hypothetical protein
LADGSFDREDFVETQIQFFFAVVFFSRPMMALAGLSVAHKAKPAVRSKAMRAIEHSRLDSLLMGWKAA